MHTVRVEHDDGTGKRVAAEVRTHLCQAEFDVIGNAVRERWMGGRMSLMGAFRM